MDERMLPGVRWTLLRTCRVGGHLGATETMLESVVRSEWLEVTPYGLRDEIHYLESRKLVDVERSDLKPWVVKLTRYGYDVVDYQVECDPGIDRPPHSSALR